MMYFFIFDYLRKLCCMLDCLYTQFIVIKNFQLNLIYFNKSLKWAMSKKVKNA